ncbi:MAG: hypothetical protein EOO36_04230 [Cytophagaceae bacterium]|nr:MAG: hypothetical protein EOO36_04230 [Cytophagaceae bacterium]
MTKSLFPLLALALGGLASCQSTPPTTAPTTAATEVAPATAPATGPAITTEAAARAAVARHIRALPNAALFVPDSARVNDNAATWQVLVPRTDWVGRMPNRARFEVDKQTGQVSSAPVK